MSIAALHSLLLAVAGGDEKAFQELFHLHKQQVYAYAMHFTRSAATSEEIVQDVFLKLWLHKEGSEEIERFEAYLYTITRNLCFDYLKKIAHERAMKQAWTRSARAAEESTEAAMIYKDYGDLVYRAIEQLPPQQKKIYALSFYQGLRLEDIAERLQISRNTVKSHLAKARATIRHFMSTHLESLILLLTAFISHRW